MRKEVIGNATLYLGDCREVVLTLCAVEAIITDPPYPDYMTDEYGASDISFLDAYQCKQFVFWSAKATFPLSYSAIHIWDKSPATLSMYERIFERNGEGKCLLWRYQKIKSSVDAQMNKDVHTEHPSQKPIRLMRHLVERTDGIVLDPFMGSGSTAIACVEKRRPFVGIEINPLYFDIACERIENAQRQERLFV